MSWTGTWTSRRAMDRGLFEEWGEIFGDEVLAAALIDRLLPLPQFDIRGNSYRVRRHSELWPALHGESEPKPRPHPRKKKEIKTA